MGVGKGQAEGSSAGRRRKRDKKAGGARGKRRGGRGAVTVNAGGARGASDEAALDAAAAHWAELKQQSAQGAGHSLVPVAALRLALVAIALAAWYLFAPQPKVVGRA